MAQFCTKCGSPLSEGVQFCTGCGAVVGASAGAAAPAAMTPVAAAPMAVPRAMPAPSPAPSSGSPILKIVLIVLAALILFGVLSAGACVYFVYRTKQRINQFSKQVSTTFPVPTETPGVHTQTPTPGSAPGQSAGPVIDTGIAIYPGATSVGSGTSMTIGSVTMKVQEYTTSDSVDQVTAFYKSKLGSNVILTQSGQHALLQLQGSNGYLNIAIEPDGNSGKTKFTIQSAAK